MLSWDFGKFWLFFLEMWHILSLFKIWTRGLILSMCITRNIDKKLNIMANNKLDIVFISWDMSFPKIWSNFDLFLQILVKRLSLGTYIISSTYIKSYILVKMSHCLTSYDKWLSRYAISWKLANFGQLWPFLANWTTSEMSTSNFCDLCGLY